MKNEKAGTGPENLRIELIMGFFLVIGAFVAALLFYIQVIKYPYYASEAKKRHNIVVEQQIGRGVIYDAEGKELAVSVKTDSICASPKYIDRKTINSTAIYLAAKLGMSRSEILRKLRSDKGFVFLKRKISKALSADIADKPLPGVFIQQEEKRYYPFKDLTAHVVGMVGFANNGLEGVELEYEKILQGKKGSMLLKRDGKQQTLGIDSVSIKKAEAGGDVYLTLDTTIQYYAYREIEKVVTRYKAKSGTVIVMNPNTGALLAMVNYPSYDPNEYEDSSKDFTRNRAVTDMYEPGSTFKPFTIPLFLEKFPNAMEYKVFCENGKYNAANRVIHDHEKYGWLTIPEVIKYSSNIGMVKLAMNINKDELYGEYVKFGFGSKTGVDLPGEVSGLLRGSKLWDETTLTSIPYGQEVAVTSLQLARAYAAIANGGYMVKPYILQKVVKNGSVAYEAGGEKMEKVLNEDEREKIVKMLELVMDRDGTGFKGRIPGYLIAGKTGTAQKHNISGKGYAANKYTTSFVGFLPAGKPEYLTLIVVDEPVPPFYYASDVAAPAFRAINQAIIAYENVMPQSSAVAQVVEEKKEAAEAVAVKTGTAPKIEKRELKIMPDFYMKKVGEATAVLKAGGVSFECFGFGAYCISQQPKKGSPMKEASDTRLFFGDLTKDNQVRIYMPNVQGLSMRKALDILGAYALKTKYSGSGFVVAQDPKPGVAINNGAKCVISFAMGTALK